MEPTWTAVYQASLSMGFSREEYWSGLPFPSPGHLPDPGIEPRCPALQADALSSEPPGNITSGRMYFVEHWPNHLPKAKSHISCNESLWDY